VTVTSHWRKSSYSSNDSACVELPRTLDAVRDSKCPDGPALSVRNVRQFIETVKLDGLNQ
jgi:hypothetical protein